MRSVRLIPTLPQTTLESLALANAYALQVDDTYSDTITAGIRIFAFMVWGQPAWEAACNDRDRRGLLPLERPQAVGVSESDQWRTKFNERVRIILVSVRLVDEELAGILAQCG
jgi:hypothetical protein